MSFFQKIYELADGADLAINIKRKNEKLTVSLLPSTGKNISPVIITGTPEALDEGFIQVATQRLDEANALQVVASQVTNAPKEHKEPKATKEAKPKDKDKPAKKAEAPKKEEPKLEHPSLF
jgi:PRTRC genetic system protein E